MKTILITAVFAALPALAQENQTTPDQTPSPPAAPQMNCPKSNMEPAHCHKGKHPGHPGQPGKMGDPAAFAFMMGFEKGYDRGYQSGFDAGLRAARQMEGKGHHKGHKGKHHSPKGDKCPCCPMPPCAPEAAPAPASQENAPQA